MRKLLLAIGILAAFSLNAQNKKNKTTVVNRSVEKNQRADTKSGYNNMLIDAINESDAAYIEFEKNVQAVWDGKLSVENINKDKKIALDKIQNYLQQVTNTPVYAGGDKYQQASIEYIVAVKAKVEELEALGIIGADKDSDSDVYNKKYAKFTDISNEAIELKYRVRNQKDVFEKTFYMKK